MRGRNDLARSLFTLWKRLPAGPKRSVRRAWFEMISAVDTGDDLLFLNHGYAPRPGEQLLSERDLAAHETPHRHSVALYRRVARGGRAAAPLCAGGWRGRDVLEVSCGRGGGAAHLARVLAPRSLVGIDLCRNAVRFCTHRHRAPNLRFEVANACDLPFPDASFDLVLNVESSFLYPDIERFFAETRRVLRPGGRLLLADYRRPARLAALRAQLGRSELAIVEQDDLSPAVADAIALDRAQRQARIDARVPRPLRGAFAKFAGLGERPDDDEALLRSGGKVYWNAVLQRGAA